MYIVVVYFTYMSKVAAAYCNVCVMLSMNSRDRDMYGRDGWSLYHAYGHIVFNVWGGVGIFSCMYYCYSYTIIRLRFIFHMFHASKRPVADG